MFFFTMTVLCFIYMKTLKRFFEQVKEGNNLLKAVYHDMQVVSFLAGC